jgi:putative DNA primase/helicase
MMTCAEVAHHFLGAPNKRLSTRKDIRWGNKGSLSVDVERDRWSDYQVSTESHDAIELVRRQLRCGYRQALEWLGGELRSAPQTSRRRKVVPQDAAKPNGAGDIWRASVPLPGTLGESYLTGRKLLIDDARIASGKVLRFHPNCPYGASGGRRPCVVALFQTVCADENMPAFQQCGIQRIPLDDRGNRAVDEDGEKLKKLSMGRTHGAAIMLTHPYSTDAYYGICEGPETGLALLNAGERNIWALGGTSGIQAFEPVPCFGLVIFADADEPGLRAARKTAQRWADAGLEAEIHIPSAFGADFADIAKGLTA